MAYFPYSFWASSNLRIGLLSHYSLENNGNDRLNKNNLSDNNTPTYTVNGKFNSALSQLTAGDVTSYLISTSKPDFQLVGNRTFALWINSLDNTTHENIYMIKAGEYLLKKSFATDFTFTVTMDDDSTIPLLAVNPDNGGDNSGIFQLVVMRVDITNNKLYLGINDNEPTEESYSIIAPKIATADFKLGNDGLTYQEHYIDEFSIWNRVLSQAEINYLYNNGNGRNYPFS